jgi:hypothetical protein
MAFSIISVVVSDGSWKLSFVNCVLLSSALHEDT